jgi:hypothetical protein
MVQFDLLNGPQKPDATDFDKWLADRNYQTAMSASTALTAARTTTTPEEAVKRRKVAAMAGTALGLSLPANLLAEPGVLGMVEGKIDHHRNVQTFMGNPKLADWMAREDNAAVASDSVEELGAWGVLFNGFARGTSRTVDGFAGPTARLEDTSEVLRRARDSQKTFGDLLTDEIAAEAPGPTRTRGFKFSEKERKQSEAGTTEGAVHPVAVIAATKRWLEGNIFAATSFTPADEAIPLLEGEAEDAARDAARAEAQRNVDYPRGRAAERAAAVLDAIPDDAGFVDTTKVIADLAYNSPGDFISFLAGIAAESAPAITAAGTTTMVTKNPFLGRAAMVGATIPSTKASSTLEQAAAMGYDLSKPEDARRLAQSDGDLDKLIRSVGVYSTVVSMIDASTAGLGSHMAKSPVGKFLVEAVAQAVAGGGGEVMARMMSGQKWTWTDAILEGLAEMVTAPLEAAGVGSSVVFRRYSEAQNNADRRGFFKALSEGSVNSNLRKRSPEAFKSAVEALTKDGPVENVHIDAGRMEQLFQDAPEELTALFDATPELDYRVFQKAAETGSTFAIPTAVYAAKIAGTSYDAKLSDNLRLQADRMSYAEAQEAMAEAETEIKAIETRVAELERTSEFDATSQAEYEGLVTQLVTAGRAPGVARAEAQVIASTVQTMAQRQGITTEEFVRRNIVPTVRREGAAATAAPFRVMRLGELSDAMQDPTTATLPEFAVITEELAERGLTPETADVDDIRLAAIAVADRGGLSSDLEEDFLLTPSGIYPATPGEALMQTVSLRNGTEDLSAYGHTPGKSITTRALALVMQKRQRALYGKINRKDFGRKTIEKMASWMADEIEFELQTPGAAADGWYTTKFQKALDIMAARFPEFSNDGEWVRPNLAGLKKVSSAYEARQLMTMIIAVTSNGARVADNYKMAVEAYRQFRETGRMRVMRGVGERGSSITNHLNRIAQLVGEFDSVADITQFLTESVTVKETNVELRKIGMPAISKMPNDARVPRATAIFGPKLGAFYANLSGADGYLTMDLWWTRTINRYRGDVLPRVSGLKNAVNSKGEPVGLHRFKWLVGQPDLTDSQALKLVVDHAQRYKDRGYKEGDEAEKAANTLYKDAFVKLQEAPLSAKERGFMIEVAGAARDELANRTGKRYSIADVQALIWYYEKRLMADMGAKENGDISYEDAARRAIGGPIGVAGPIADAGAGVSDGTGLESAAAADGRRLPDLDRAEVLTGALKGDGRKFTNFFADVTAGRRQKPKNLDGYTPVIDLPPEVGEFSAAREKYSGNFDKHIMTSIPGYREMQDAVGYAISQVLNGGSILRIGASEGSTVKAIVELAGNGATGVAMDPNLDMQRTFEEKGQVPGVRFDFSAFGAIEDAGNELWTEDTGEVVRVFDPGAQRFDVVVEQMVFQFISNARGAQVAAAKGLMKPGGLFYTAEKVGGPAEAYRANEAKKDSFKAQYYSPEELEAKRQEVLQTGGDAVEGMTDLQVSNTEIEAVLRANFAHVVQVWDSGNFKGYAASDDPAKLAGFLQNLPSLASEYATVETPRLVGEPAMVLQQSSIPPDAATPADFDGELKLSSFRKKGWFIISATQSHFGDWDSADNVAEAQRLRDFLAATGLAHREVRGRYAATDDGPSFLVFGNEATYGATMRDMFRQESILTRQGFVYGEEGRKPVPIIGLREGAALKPDEDYQTTLPDGRTFTLDLDWPDAKSDDPRDDLFRREDGLTELTHWSPRERATIDPRHAGKGKLPGPERHRSGPKKAFFGLNHGKRNTAYERESPDLGGLKHTVAVDPQKLYPWDTDPDGLRDKVDGKLPAPQQIGAYETLIKRAGYAGYFVIDGPLGDVAAVFDALPVERVERDMALYQSGEAFFKSALSQAILDAKQETAPAQDWLKIIPKLPGVKKAELEWTGLAAWLEGQDPTRKLTRQHIYHWLSSAQVQIEVVDGPGTFSGYATELSTPADYEEILITVPNLDEIGPNAGRGVVSTIANSGHFDTPNIVVHARVQRTGDTLFVGEVQSDLNSFWRKRGGQVPSVSPEQQEMLDELRRLEDVFAAGEIALLQARNAFDDTLRDTSVSFFEGQSFAVSVNIMDDILGASSRARGNLARSLKLAEVEGHFETFDAFAADYLKSALDRTTALYREMIDAEPHIRNAMALLVVRKLREAAAPGWQQAFVTLDKTAEARQEARADFLQYRRDLPPGLVGREDGQLPLPFSPFEGESAVQLAMKYLTTYAAREGFKKIAWTPGYMQMARWGVQEQRAQGMIARWFVQRGSDGQQTATADLNDGQYLTATFGADGTITRGGDRLNGMGVEGRHLREVFPAALVEQFMQPFADGERLRTGTGEDLPEVNLSDNAGQGYRIVYDQQMKRFLEKWAGKFGAKVESDTSLARGNEERVNPEAVRQYLNYWRMGLIDGQITPEQVRRFRNAVVDHGNASFSVEPAMQAEYVAGNYAAVIEIGMTRMDNTRVARVARAIGDERFFVYAGDPVWSLTLTDEFRAEASKPQPLFQNRPGGARGQIILPPVGSDAAPEITVFDKADLSTVMHEGGHWMLWLLQTGARAGDQFSTEATQTVNAWFVSQAEDIANEMGLIAPQVLEYLSKGTTGAADVDDKVHRGLHERFARGFEAYLREGKAPSIALRGVFHRFAAWLMEVYKSAKRLRVELSDEVRQVFDKMIATDAQITQARSLSVGAEQIAATAKAMGLDEASYEELVRLQDEERSEAFGLALRETMAPIMAQRSAEARALRNGLMKEVSEEVNGQRHNRAFEWLANGRWVGSAEAPDDLPADLRMDPELLADEYGQELLDKLPRGRRPMTKAGSGLTADEVAGWFGYDSGADMLNDFVTKPRAKDEIRNQVQAKLAERLAEQDPRTEGDAAEAMVEALHGEKHGQVLAAELRAINRVSAAPGKITSRQQAAQIARDVIARMKVRDAIRSNLYAQQARTFGEQAARLLIAGDTNGAFEAKRKQLIQHSLFVESRKAADLVARTERKAAKLKRSGTRKNLAGEYLEAIDDLLYTYDFRKLSAAAEAKRGGLLRYMEMMIKAGRENELSIPDHLITDAKRVPYKTLTVQRLQGVLDALSNIEHTARLKKKLLDKQREREMDEVVSDIEQAFSDNIKGRDLNRVPTGFERVRDAVKEFVNYATNADTLLRRIDGWRTGAVYGHLKEGIDRASSQEVVMRQRAALELDKLFTPYDRGERRRMAVRQRWDGYDQSLSKWDLISIALNSGNKDNWERLTSRDNAKAVTPLEARALLEHLDERDWKFVQSAWDHLDAEYWPQIAEREKRTTGVVPKKVEAMLMVEGLPGMPAGVRGGYYPIVYDRRFSAKVAEEKHQEIQNAMQAGRFGKAQTRNGHTKERAAGSGGRTVELGIHVLFGHVNQVIHDLALSEEVANAWKVLQEPRVKGLFEQAGLLVDHASLEVWLQDVAAGQIVTGGVLGRMARHAKSGFTVSKLAFNMSTVAIQFTGLAQSMAVIGKAPMVKAYSSYVAQGMYPAGQRIKARSVFMREREMTFQRDMFDLIGEATRNPTSGMLADGRGLLMAAGFWAMQKVQFYVVDAPTWMAGYEQGRKQGMSDDEAAQHADRIVARAQASGIYADRTAIERGTLGRDTRQNEFIRLFTALGSYMFAKFNVAQEIAGRTARDVRADDKSSVAALLNGTIDLALIFTVEAVLYNLIKGTLPGDDEEDEQSWLAFLARETALSAMGTLPFIRDMASALQGFNGGGAYGGVADIFGRVGVQVGQGEVDQSLFRSVNELVGVAVPGYPSVALWRLVAAEAERQDGGDVSPMSYIMGLPR